jgi:NtrC-family two-component system response regulator AlgB
MDVLLIDDDASLRRTIRMTLDASGHRVVDVPDGAQALEVLAARTFAIALLDLHLARESGLDLLPKLLKAAPGLAVIVITAYATFETAVDAMRLGALDYLPKPFTPDQLRVTLNRVARVRRLESQLGTLQDELREVNPGNELETLEPAFRQAVDLAYKAAASEAAVLLRGESGTGKGVVARAIHSRSYRATAPFVTVHCPSLSAELLESELFGHAKGAFTGAVRDTTGKVAAAEGGTLFLDEVGDLPPALQPKLLRLLQDKQYERVGEAQTRAGNVRIVAATNRDLEAAIAAGKFREDLFYRLNVIEVTVPPLRQRPADVLPLAHHLLKFFARQAGKEVTNFTPEAEAALTRHPWPGNVRELRNAVERAVILTSAAQIGLADLPGSVGVPSRSGIEVGGRVSLEQLEAEHIRRILQATATMEEAATTLGIDPSTLYRKRKRYGL